MSHSRSGNSSGSFITFLIPFLLMVGVVIYVVYQDKKRKKALNDFCIRNGMTYQDKVITLPSTAQRFAIVNLGAERTISSVMSGTRNNIKFYIFEVTSEQLNSSQGSRNRKHNACLGHTVCLMINTQTRFPSFYLRDSSDKLPKTFQFLGMEIPVPNPYNLGIDILNPDKKYEKKGGKNIELTDYPDFCSDFVLKGCNEEEVYQYFTPERINAFMDNHQPGYQYEAKEDCFMVSKPYVTDLDGRLDLFKKSMVIYNSLISTPNNPT
ncbi:MAG: hypothetical protein IKO19_09235 [Candidatus Riflebacteria bacterium]|nr:hypothetical protein [Candidatus Riflebacteria bacterium]MBR4570826.1 hypothetical protein [Candidatus Riflebacteria bacterium]